MNTSFTKEGAAELTGRFNRTFISINTENNVKLPIYVREISDVDDGRKSLHITGNIVNPVAEDWLPYSKVVKESSLDYFSPPPGLRNYRSYAFYYDIIPLRHKYRGLTRDQLRCTFFGTTRADNVPMESAMFQYTLFNPSYMAAESAYELVRKKKLSSAAFSPKFAMARLADYKSPVIIYKRKPVALYSKEDNAALLTASTEHVKEELSNYLKCIVRK
jgi:hypothetical protein